MVGATILTGACTDQSVLPTGSTSDPAEPSVSTVNPLVLHALMINGGCRDANGSDGALTMVLAPPGGSATRYDCTAIGRDSMFTLASSYRSLASSTPEGFAAAQATPGDEGGYWDYEGYWREYCLISGDTGEVLYCGVWYYFEYPVWVGGSGSGSGGGGGTAGGGGGGGSTGGTTTGPTVSPTPQPDEVPLDRCDFILTPGCHTPLTADDITNLNASYQYLRDTSGVWADTVAQRQCLELFRGLELLRTLPSPGGVYRGIDSLAVIDPMTGDMKEVQDAQAGQRNYRLHFDPPILTKATTIWGRKQLLATALHETAHAIGLADHVEVTATGDTVSSTDYARFDYFRYTSVGGPNSCTVP